MRMVENKKVSIITPCHDMDCELMEKAYLSLKQMNLKIELDTDEECQIFQNDKRIVKSTEGFYEIGFNEGILQIVGKKKGKQ